MQERLQLRVFISSVQKEMASERLALQIMLTTDPFLQQHTKPALFEREPHVQPGDSEKRRSWPRHKVRSWRSCPMTHLRPICARFQVNLRLILDQFAPDARSQASAWERIAMEALPPELSLPSKDAQAALAAPWVSRREPRNQMQTR